MLTLALIILMASLIFIAVRALPLKARAQRLQQHPVLLAAQRAQSLPDKLADLPDQLALIQSRVEVIATNIARIVASSASLQFDVKLIGRSTDQLLETFVPALRGSLK